MKVTRFVIGSCACGCGTSIPIRTGNKIQRFVFGHQHKGLTFSEEHRHKLAISKLAENNPQWKGSKVKRTGLHIWVRNHLPEPEKCQICNIAPPYDLANITGKYNRDLENWQYLCRRCHMDSDGRLERLHPK